MTHVTYTTKMIFNTDSDKQKMLEILETERFTWNECSKVMFDLKKKSIVELHRKFYKKFRRKYKNIPSYIVVRTQTSVISIYKNIKSNNHKLNKAPEKKKLSIRLDHNCYSYKDNQLKISTLKINNRISTKFHIYSKLQEYLDKYKFGDPLLFERDGNIWIALTFKIPDSIMQENSATGIDLGIKNYAATSDGKLYRDQKFNAQKRKLRYLKRCLQSKADKKSKTAKKHLRKLSKKEANINRNFTHHLANRIIQDSKVDVLVIENLKGLKKKDYPKQNKNHISQIPFFQLKQFLIYKAQLQNKQVKTVNPSYTSQIDCRTNEKTGTRLGSRYIGSDGQILHADVNAACNIVLRSKLPCSISNYFAWQVAVERPIVGY